MWDTSFSDHISVSCLFSPDAVAAEQSRSFFFEADSFFLSKPTVKEKLNVFWENSLAESNAEGLELFVHAWVTLRAEVKRLQYEDLQQLSELDSLRRQLEDLTVGDNLTEAEEALVLELSEKVRRLQAWHDHRWKLWSRERFLKQGEVSSPFFFKRFRLKRRKLMVQSLRTEAGAITSSDGISREFFNHFSSIFSLPLTDTDVVQQEQFLEVVRNRADPGQLAFMDDGFILGRNVHSNILFFSFLHEALKRERKTGFFLMLDFAKAFDSMKHDFIFKALEMLGFSNFFVGLIRSITVGGYARVMVNN
ncbi:hypothetical protein R1sor_026604 [Riccia sorocarpa]|uniref:Reverse transcriptase domain-containing protein n=1 Tax=Riccia sorocarpa TaxID=122646 RepID=A0ABD3GDC5_9MARC